jgi:hypothetical protein
MSRTKWHFESEGGTFRNSAKTPGGGALVARLRLKRGGYQSTIARGWSEADLAQIRARWLQNLRAVAQALTL